MLRIVDIDRKTARQRVAAALERVFGIGKHRRIRSSVRKAQHTVRDRCTNAARQRKAFRRILAERGEQSRDMLLLSHGDSVLVAQPP